MISPAHSDWTGVLRHERSVYYSYLHIFTEGGIIGVIEYQRRKLHYLDRLMKARFGKYSCAPLTDVIYQSEGHFAVSQRVRLLEQLICKFPASGNMRSVNQYGSVETLSLSETVGSLANITRDMPAITLFFLSVHLRRSKAIQSSYFEDVTVPGPWKPSYDCSFDVANPTITKSVQCNDMVSCRTLRLGLRFGIRPISLVLAVTSIAWSIAYLGDYPPPQRFIFPEDRREFMELYSACSSPEILERFRQLRPDGNANNSLLQRSLGVFGIDAERTLCAERNFQIRHKGQ